MTFIHVATLIATTLFVMVLLPRIIFPLNRIPGTAFDRVIAGAILMTGVSVATMYVLGAFRMLELLGLITVWALTWWVLKGRHQPKGRFGRFGYAFFSFWDRTEAKGARAAVHEVRETSTARAEWRSRRGMRAFRDRITDPGVLIPALAVTAVVFASAALRFQRAITNVELVPQDSYLALFWTKSINQGVLFLDGIYPQGGYLWMSLIDRFYIFDTYTFVRFAGPLMGVLELILLYWAVSRATRSRTAGLVTLTAMGFFAGHPALAMIWERQIGSMTQEFSLAFAVVSLVYGALYMADRSEPHLWLSGTALFMAVTTHAISLVVLGIGFPMLILAGLAAAAWTSRTLVRLVVVGIVSTVAANLYFLIGFLQGQNLALSFFLYDPRNVTGYTGTGADAAPAAPGQELTGNLIFQLAFIGALAAIAIGLVVAWRRRPHGAVLAGFALPVAALMLFYDLIAVRMGVLFRVRQAWITGELVTVGLGLGVGALVVLAASLSEVEDPLWDRLRGALRVKRAGLELGALVVAVLLLVALFPRYSAVARVAGPSGYPNATEVSLDIIRSEDRLKFTFVGLSEQFQEAYSIGQFVEAWVFAKDITFGQARDPGYDIPIPTDRVYLFVEKVPFPGPQSLWWGPTEEYYRTHVKRQRIMDRIREWAETYRQFHGDMTVEYEDAEIIVYKVDRTVDLGRADLDPAFKGPSYAYNAGWYFHSDAEVTADRIEPDRNALPQRSCEGYGEPCFPAEVIREQAAGSS